MLFKDSASRAKYKRKLAFFYFRGVAYVFIGAETKVRPYGVSITHSGRSKRRACCLSTVEMSLYQGFHLFGMSSQVFTQVSIVEGA